jgi:hypothetical protein
MASWAPLVSGVVGEVIWLFTGPRLAAFRRRTDALRDRAESARAVEALGPEYGERVLMVEREVNEIDELCASRPDITSEERREIAHRLRPMIQSFVGVCAAHQRLRRVALQAPLRELQAEVSTLHQSLATETDLGVRASLRRALSVAERRIKQLEGNEAATRSLELALQTLHRSLAMLKEAAAGLSAAVDLCAEIDAAVSQLNRAAALEADRENELGPPGRVSALPPALN